MGEGSSLTCNENAATLAWGKGLASGDQGSPPGRALIPELVLSGWNRGEEAIGSEGGAGKRGEKGD